MNRNFNTNRSGAALVAFLVLSLLAAGCGDDSASPSATSNSNTSTSTTSSAPSTSPTVTSPNVGALQPAISCGDAAFNFATPTDDLLLWVDVAGLLARAEASTGSLDASYDLADPASGAVATLQSGTGLGTAACNDVIGSDYEVRDAWTATGGTVDVRIPEVPEGPLAVCATGFESSATISGLTFIVEDETLTVPDLTLDGTIGWCAG